jgi:hypothetical protein
MVPRLKRLTLPPSTTKPLATINELWTGYHLWDRAVWWNAEAEQAYTEAKDRVCAIIGMDVGQAQIAIAEGRGQAQAEEVKSEWQFRTGTEFRVIQIAWCAVKNTIQHFIPQATRKHPADLIVKLEGGTWLGISCKYRRKGKGTDSYKNPGLGPLAVAFGVELKSIVARERAALGLPKLSQEKLKVMIRANALLQTQTRAAYDRCARAIRDRLYEAAVALPAPRLATIVRSTLLDCDRHIVPRYVRVVGTGDSPETFRATFYNPFAVPPLDNLTVHKVADMEIGFKSGYHGVCKLRLKPESEPFASAFKSSVDQYPT